MEIKENNKTYQIFKCDTPKSLEEFTEFNRNCTSKYICVDLEFNAKIAQSKKFPNIEITDPRKIALIQINYEPDAKIYVINPEELTNEQLEVFLDKIICNDKMIKILHGSDALDIPYLYNNLMGSNKERILNFTKGLIDIRYLCEFEDPGGKCQIYELLIKAKIIDQKKKDYLEKNEEIMGEIYDVYIDIHDLSDELLIYSVYDVVYLLPLFLYYKNKDPEIYGHYLPELTRIIFLHKRNYIDIIKMVQNQVTLMNNFMIYVTLNEKEILHNMYLITVSIFDNEFIKKLMDINYFRTEMMNIFKFILYDTLNLFFELYKNKTEKYEGSNMYDKFVDKLKDIHYMYILDIVVTIRKFIIDLINK